MLCYVTWLPVANGQRLQDPVYAGRGPDVEASVGYSYVNAGVPSGDRISLNGVDSGMTAYFRPRFGLCIDLGYARAANVLGSNKHSDMLDYMAGPVFSPVKRRKQSIYIRGLVGGARISGTTPAENGGYVTGFAAQFAWSIGIGAQYQVSHSVAVRAGFDSLHTCYFNSSERLQGQENAHATITFVYLFNRGR